MCYTMPRAITVFPIDLSCRQGDCDFNREFHPG